MEKELISVQLAYFFKAPFEKSFEKISMLLKDKLGEGATMYIPIPTDAPIEIPRLQITFPTYNVNVAKNRMDIFCKDLVLVKDISKKIGEIDLASLGIEINRIGYVKQYYVNGNVDNLKVILATNFNQIPLTESSIRIVTKSSIDRFEYKSIEEVSTGFIQEPGIGGSKKFGLILLRDTLMEEQASTLNSGDQQTVIEHFEKESEKFQLIELNK